MNRQLKPVLVHLLAYGDFEIVEKKNYAKRIKSVGCINNLNKHNTGFSKRPLLVLHERNKMGTGLVAIRLTKIVKKCCMLNWILSKNLLKPAENPVN